HACAFQRAYERCAGSHRAITTDAKQRHGEKAMLLLFPTAPLRSALRLVAPVLVASMSAAHGAEFKPQVAVVAFGLNGDQSVFESEATKAAKVAADRFGSSSVTVRVNTKSREEANSETVSATLKSTAETLHAENDVLFVILTSHGDQAGLEVK